MQLSWQGLRARGGDGEPSDVTDQLDWRAFRIHCRKHVSVSHSGDLEGWRAEKYAANEIGNRKGQSVRMREWRVEKGSEEFNEY